MKEIFELLLAQCAQSFERLPCVEDADLLRNILLLRRMAQIQLQNSQADPAAVAEWRLCLDFSIGNTVDYKHCAALWLREMRREEVYP